MKHHALMPLLVLCLVVAGCRALDGYRRTYTVAVEDKFGQKVSFGVTLDPPQAAGMAAELQRMERAGVIAQGVMKREASQELLQPGAEKLAILSAPAPVPTENDRQGTGGLRSMPPSPAVPTVWLTRDGKLWTGSYVPEIAARRAAGWMDAPPPGFEDGQVFPWVNGDWLVPGAPRPAVAATEKPTAAKAAAPWKGGRRD